MKRFKFSLQTVHDFREFRRDTAEREFAEVTAQLHRAKAQLDEVKRTHDLALDNYLLLYQCREIKVSKIAAHTDFINSLNRREREVRGQILTIERHLESKRLALTEALRDTKTTSKLRERQRQRHDLDSARREQNLLDEMAVSAIARRLVHR
jgi:flagellar export protein FliJ